MSSAEDGSMCRVGNDHANHGDDAMTIELPEILGPQNLDGGFFGTTRRNTGCSDEEARDAWDDVSVDVLLDFGLTSEETRDFLDSKSGRHIADAMTDGDRKISGDLPAWTGREVKSFLKGRRQGAGR